MGKRRILWIIFTVFMLIIILCLGVVGELSLASLRSFHEHSQTEALTAMAQLIRQHCDRELFTTPAGRARAARLARETQHDARLRLTLIAPDGRVVADSEDDPARMDNHAGRAEIQAVLRGEESHRDIRFSNTLKTPMLYVAIPVREGRQIIGVVRVARSMAQMEGEMASMRQALWRSGLIAALVAGLCSLYLSRRMSRPIEIMREAAERYARGDTSRRLYVSGPAEFVALAKSLNRMTREIDRRIREIILERNEREAILHSMREGVLAVDREERIMMLNPAAELLLGIKAPEAVGRLVQEVLRHAEFQRFLARTMEGQPPSPEESLLHWPGERLLQIDAAPLRGEGGVETGLLIVINDVTRLHKLENLRREFVANVSHELRTPITSIKGFIETLRDGAINDPDNAGRFLDIIARQADRLNAIIEDLLALSRLERQAEENEGIKTAPCRLSPFLVTVVQHFGPQSREKKIAITLDCPAELTVPANAPLLEQAIGNLLDNAIKYSPPNKPIQVSAQAEGGEAVIEVADRGCGIPAQHLPRIFERFYRVDPARSREAGGTGLGLSIVKHIVQAHGGRVEVASEMGRGSTFRIRLPLTSGPECAAKID